MYVQYRKLLFHVEHFAKMKLRSTCNLNRGPLDFLAARRPYN